jgi:hypothetical protein
LRSPTLDLEVRVHQEAHSIALQQPQICVRRELDQGQICPKGGVKPGFIRPGNRYCRDGHIGQAGDDIGKCQAIVECERLRGRDQRQLSATELWKRWKSRAQTGNPTNMNVHTLFASQKPAGGRHCEAHQVAQCCRHDIR